jgi:hypothetical protein
MGTFPKLQACDMKPAAFCYHAPKTVAEAVAALAEFGPLDGRVLAGGQSLVPTMAFRLAKPAHLIDINGVDELNCIRTQEGRLVIGACTRHAAFHRPVCKGPLGTLLTKVVHHIAHYPGTVPLTVFGARLRLDDLTLAIRAADFITVPRRSTIRTVIKRHNPLPAPGRDSSDQVFIAALPFVRATAAVRNYIVKSLRCGCGMNRHGRPQMPLTMGHDAQSWGTGDGTDQKQHLRLRLEGASRKTSGIKFCHLA